MLNVMSGVRPTMKLSLIVLLLASFLLSQLGCRSLDTRAEKTPANKCQEDLKRIPEIATLLKSRVRAEGEEDEKPPRKPTVVKRGAGGSLIELSDHRVSATQLGTTKCREAVSMASIHLSVKHLESVIS